MTLFLPSLRTGSTSTRAPTSRKTVSARYSLCFWRVDTWYSSGHAMRSRPLSTSSSRLSLNVVPTAMRVLRTSPTTSSQRAIICSLDAAGICPAAGREDGETVCSDADARLQAGLPKNAEYFTAAGAVIGPALTDPTTRTSLVGTGETAFVGPADDAAEDAPKFFFRSSSRWISSSILTDDSIRASCSMTASSLYLGCEANRSDDSSSCTCLRMRRRSASEKRPASSSYRFLYVADISTRSVDPLARTMSRLRKCSASPQTNSRRSYPLLTTSSTLASATGASLDRTTAENLKNTSWSTAFSALSTSIVAIVLPQNARTWSKML